VPRRVSLPAADELFRTTGGSAVQSSASASQNRSNGEEPPGKEAPGSTRVPAPASAAEPDAESSEEPPAADSATGAEDDAAGEGDRGEHSAVGEGEDPGAQGSAPPDADGSRAAEGVGEHTGRERTGQDRQAAAPRHTVPGQGVPQNMGRGRGTQEGQAPTDGSSRIGGQPGQPAADIRAQAQQKPGRGAEPRSRQGTAGSPRRGGGRGANRRPSGRERHDEKITVYISAEELMDLEHARLVLRGEHGLAVDRGRIVREAVAVVLADLESRGDASILVRRLRGR